MPNPYNDVVVTEAEKASLETNENAIESPIPRLEEVQESEQGVNEVADFSDASEVNPSDIDLDNLDSLPDVNPEDYLVEDEGDDTYEIGGQEFSIDQILEWKNDSENNRNWNQKNTQKAQELARWNALNDRINNDNDFKTHIKDYFYNDEDSYRKLGLDDSYESLRESETLNPEDYEIKESQPSDLESRVQELEFEKQVNNMEVEFDQLVRDNSEIFDNEDDEIQFLEFVEENEIPDLNLAFNLYTRDFYKSEAEHARQLNENAGRNYGRVVMNSSVGARDVRTPSRPKNYKEITMDNPDISQYFD
tara:strand:+ start:5876 stop:6793 length:918 start_codon:yes stop_codon:yes gene_type:complete